MFGEGNMSSIHVSGFVKHQINLQEDIHGVTNKIHHITLAETEKKANILNNICATTSDIQHQIHKKVYSITSAIIPVGNCHTSSKIPNQSTSSYVIFGVPTKHSYCSDYRNYSSTYTSMTSIIWSKIQQLFKNQICVLIVVLVTAL